MQREALLTEEDLSKRWQCGRQSLTNQRYEGRGPRWIKLGRLVRYRLADVEAYENSQAQGGAAA